MTTTGTAAFNLDIADIIEEAFERCGSEARTGYHFATARRSLNLLLIEWANRGVNLWTIDEVSLTLAAGVAAYNLPLNTVDVLETSVRLGTGGNQLDRPMSRVSASMYAGIASKNTPGIPTQVWVDRRTGADTPTGVQAPRVVLWPVPDKGYQMRVWRLRRMQDMGDGGGTADIPFRFLEAMISGLAWKLAAKLPGVEMERASLLKSEYEAQFQLAADEDREKADATFIPFVPAGYR